MYGNLHETIETWNLHCHELPEKKCMKFSQRSIFMFIEGLAGQEVDAWRTLCIFTMSFITLA